MEIVTGAAWKGESWPVKVRERRPGRYDVTGRGSLLDVFLLPKQQGENALAVVANWRRAGFLPPDCDRLDVMEYLDWPADGGVDAATLAAAVRAILAAKKGGE